VLISAVVISLGIVLALDEGSQFDPRVEFERLDAQLKAIPDKRTAVLARKAKIEELVSKASDGTIPEERLPPVWQLPVMFKDINEWRAAAKRRLKRCAEELQVIDETERKLTSEIAALPPLDAKRVSIFRRALNAVLGNIEQAEVE
jgi:hypothetical protein